jgi:hypothetical protein
MRNEKKKILTPRVNNLARQFRISITHYRADTIDKQKDYVRNVLKKELKTDQQVFQKVYNFSFDFAKQQGQKSMRTLFCFVFSLFIKNLNRLLFN